jgi:xanthine dehydrogenase molybdopterin-binding subunit B
MGAVCIIPDEVPQKRYNERQVSIPAKTYKDRTVLPHKVRHVGEGFVAVAHKTEALDEKAIRAINVEYEVLPAYTLSAIGNSSLRHIFYLVELVARSSSQILLFWKQVRQFSYLWVY